MQEGNEGMPVAGQERSETNVALLARARGGDVAARLSLLERYRPLLATVVARHARRLPRGALAKDDLWQEAYRHCLELVAGYGGDSEGFGAYLKQVLDWRIANLVRSEQRRCWLAAGRSAEELDLPQPEPRSAPDSPRLRAALRQLSPKQRAVLYHYHWEGRVSAEVAALLGLTPQAVTALRRRAEGRLRRALLPRSPSQR